MIIAFLVMCSWMPIDTFLADGQRLSASLGVTDVVSAIAIPAPSPGDVFWSHKARSSTVNFSRSPKPYCKLWTSDEWVLSSHSYTCRCLLSAYVLD